MKSFDKLKTKLTELFQLDQADLDFGIYRIMNLRRDEIVRFLEHDLLPQVREAFGEYESSDKVEIQKELDKVVEGIEAAGMDPEQSPKVQELRARLAEEAVDITALENEVYDHLYSFFSRYYDEGDFISLRRYKEGVYAIPYEGEEVKLHWANRDQYYIKTTEYFRDYAFKTPSGHGVHFKIVEGDTEKDNVKAPNGKDRCFLLHSDRPVAEENGEIVIRFEYCHDGEKRKQATINEETAKRVMENLNDEKLVAWQQRLSAKCVSAEGPKSEKTVLDKHISDFTKRNTFDYFIHKDLGGFLRRELDFYIKNEVMRLDDVEEESTPRVEQYLSKIKVIRRIAHKIIEFLGQIEGFQKKLWLKKKFVVDTNYCVTLDRVPEGLYSEIVENDAQREEWVQLFAIDEIKKDLAGAVEYSEPLTVDFLKANPFLILDTRFFSADFKGKLLASFDDIERMCDGVLFQSENFQAVRLMTKKYCEDVECIYIDPPYNTDASPILYKNGYRVSSWVSMMEGRLCACRQMLKKNGVLAVAIDDAQQRELSFLLSSAFNGNDLGIICVRSNPSGRPMQTGYSVSHEYILFAGRSRESVIGRMPPTPKQLARFSEEDDEGCFEWRNLRREGSNSDRSARRHLYYPIYLGPEGIRVPRMDWDEGSEAWVVQEEASQDEQIVYPDNDQGQQKTWRWSPKKVIGSISQLAIRKDRSGKDYVYYKRRPHKAGVVSVSSWFDAKYSATEHGTALLKDLFGTNPFSYPKSLFAVCDSIYIGGASDGNSTVLDFFAGSGTTAHAVIHLNRKGGRRKYILVEMGGYFDTVLAPRIKKVVYSRDWKDGKPISREGVSHMFKYMRLESYEDALANIQLKRTETQQSLLEATQGFRESYMLGYMLEAESKGSQTLLDIDDFDDPFNYRLLVGTGSVGETKPVKVDLVETFNWLLGLKVRHIDRISGFQVVEGTNPKGEKVLVLWRKIRDLAKTDSEKVAAARDKANRDLEMFFKKQQYNTLDSEFDVIYVNGDNNLMNVPLDPDKEGIEPRYKVRLIEEEFKSLMFDVEDV
jgi:adenine-specific DNA-methyltransferase